MIAWLTSPIGRALAAALAVVVLVLAGGIYAKGRVDGSHAAELRVAREVAAEQARQSAAEHAATDAARKRADAAEILATEKEQEIADYEQKIAALGAARACPLSDVDVDGLRKLLR